MTNFHAVNAKFDPYRTFRECILLTQVRLREVGHVYLHTFNRLPLLWKLGHPQVQKARPPGTFVALPVSLTPLPLPGLRPAGFSRAHAASPPRPRHAQAPPPPPKPSHVSTFQSSFSHTVITTHF